MVKHQFPPWIFVGIIGATLNQYFEVCYVYSKVPNKWEIHYKQARGKKCTSIWHEKL